MLCIVLIFISGSHYHYILLFFVVAESIWKPASRAFFYYGKFPPCFLNSFFPLFFLQRAFGSLLRAFFFVTDTAGYVTRTGRNACNACNALPATPATPRCTSTGSQSSTGSLCVCVCVCVCASVCVWVCVCVYRQLASKNALPTASDARDGAGAAARRWV